MDVFIRYKYLLKLLIVKDLKLKYRQSFLGYLWSILNPLFVMIVLAVVFSTIFSGQVEHFPVYLLSGNMLYSFVRESSIHAMNSIIGNGSLIRKTYVPKYIFTLAAVTSDLINMLFSMMALFLVMLATGVPFTPYIFLAVIPLAELYVFSIGLGLFLAQANVFLRDIQHIWNPFVLIWMYVTPIIYPMKALSEPLQWIISRFNPLYYYVVLFRDFVMYGQVPWWPNVWRGGIFSILMLLIGLWSFARAKDRFILYI
jgi:lipopolysaccharide transport system permease protein